MESDICTFTSYTVKHVILLVMKTLALWSSHLSTLKLLLIREEPCKKSIGNYMYICADVQGCTEASFVFEDLQVHLFSTSILLIKIDKCIVYLPTVSHINAIVCYFMFYSEVYNSLVRTIYYTILVLYNTSTIRYYTILVLYYTILYYTILYYTILVLIKYSIVLV
uniref:Uncharacterized protein n=1 Tax=Glossina austeni TaxID=7395 RepID=A0A1A9VX05_GLOAU